MYDFSASSGGGSGTSSGKGQSFSNSLLNYFNNSNIYTTIFDLSNPSNFLKRYINEWNVEGNANFNIGKWNYLALDTNLTLYKYFGSNFRMNNTMLSQIIIHELGHGILNINDKDGKETTWLKNTNSEVFASYIENMFLNERQLTLRANYYEPSMTENFHKSSLLLNFNIKQNENTINNLKILNSFKKILQTIPNTDFIFK